MMRVFGFWIESFRWLSGWCFSSAIAVLYPTWLPGRFTRDRTTGSTGLTGDPIGTRLIPARMCTSTPAIPFQSPPSTRLAPLWVAQLKKGIFCRILFWHVFGINSFFAFCEHFLLERGVRGAVVLVYIYIYLLYMFNILNTVCTVYKYIYILYIYIYACVYVCM